MLRCLVIGIVLLVLSAGCGEDPFVEPGDLEHIPFGATPYTPQIPQGFPQLEQPASNPMTVEGVWLGRKLFFDPILSRDSTMSCSSCHLQASGFTDALPVSEGVDGIAGKRSAMSLINAGFMYNGLFWDGRAASLEEQALLPVEDPIELHDTWDNVEAKLQRHPDYPADFRRAFGIRDKEEITRDLTVRAIAQFERTLISTGQSRFDQFMRGEIFLEENEFNGFEMYFDISGELPDAECAHCHAAPLLTTNGFRNNGIEDVATIDDFPDLGLGAVTGDRFDNGKFKIPTLRNIEYTAPYMHDGRFATLEEVIEHYNSGGFRVENTDPLIRPLGLTEQQKADLLAFLLTFSDTTFLTKEAFSNPF
ncbi:MAG: cytochrome c peroxidase [Saprospiraceae bacterium]|nr:cytochrome c peroxidase [Saprospiraceae bacterium]